MATDPIGSISGLASGTQWRDLVDQLIKAESARRLDPVTKRIDAASRASTAWGTYSGLVSTFRTAAQKLRDATAFDTPRVSLSGAGVDRPPLTASGSGAASPGTYAVEVLAVARADKLSGTVYSSATTALGITGDVSINGRAVSITAADTLESVRDKINVANTGATPSGVSASVLVTGAGAYRLVLTSDTTGAEGIRLFDSSSGALAQLGVVESSSSMHEGATGGAQTDGVSSATAAIAAILGVTVPPPSTIKVGGRTITVDLSVDSLTSIRSKIGAAGGAADVMQEDVAGKTRHRLVTSDAVEVDATDAANSRRTLEALGFFHYDKSAIAQVARSEWQYTEGAGGAAATGATLLTDLAANGAGFGVGVGDTVRIQGKRGDGSTVSLTLAVGAGTTLQDLATQINDATSGFGAGTRTATASVSGGRLVLTDNTAGDSQLALSVSVSTLAGGTISLGHMETQTTGRARQVVAGSDAVIKVDGVTLRRASNTITDAIGGVSLSLQRAEVGTPINVVVERDTSAVTTAMQSLATSYNELIKFTKQQSGAGQPLATSSSLRTSRATMTQVLLSEVTGLGTSPYTSATVAGISLQKDGRLAVDSTKLSAAMATNFDDVRRLFATTGTATSPDLAYVASLDATTAGSYAVQITAAATSASSTGAGFGGTYADDGTADTMSFTETGSGATGSVSLANGDTVDTIVAKLNAMFTAQKMKLTASNSGGQLSVRSTEYGSGQGFTVAYTAGGADGTAQLGLAAGTFAGTNVAGTIGGAAATGVGQILTADTGTAAEGLAVKYAGTGTGAIGTLTFVRGLGGDLVRAADAIVRPGDGIVAAQQEVLDRAGTDLRARAAQVSARLERRRAALVKQFAGMERAISKLQSASNSVTALLAQRSSQ